MNQETLYRLSCRAARELQESLEQGSLDQISEKLAAIRRYIDLAETVPAEQLRGRSLHHREQLELLAGITENLTGALDGLRQRIETSLRARQSLLNHVLANVVPATSQPIPRIRHTAPNLR